MRIFQLARVAAEAESVRIKARIHRMVGSLIIGLIALIFLLCALGFGHLALWGVLREHAMLSPAAAAGILAGGDLAIAAILAWRAAKSPPTPEEIEARRVRQRAVDGITSSATTSTAVVTTLLTLWRARKR